MWVVHPVLSTDVVVRGITVDSLGPNNDGCNPDSCRDVVISGCSFDTGDDCIAHQVRPRRRRPPCRRTQREHRDRELPLRGPATALSPSAAKPAAEHPNIIARDLHITGPAIDHALRIKTNSYRGGVIEHITLLDSVVDTVTASAILIDTHHADPDITGSHHPTVRDISLSALEVRNAQCTLEIRDSPHSPVRDVTLSAGLPAGHQPVRMASNRSAAPN